MPDTTQSSGSGGGSGPDGLAIRKAGLLDNVTVAQLLDKGINVADSKYSCEDLFGSLTGAALLDAIYDKFGAGEHDVAWYTSASDGGKPIRNVVRSSLSRPIQESTCANYMQRMYKEGLSQLASGHLAVQHCSDAVFRFRDKSREPPFEAGSFNHRAEAFYRCFEESPDHEMIQKIHRRGLTRVKFMLLDKEGE
eukprot:s1602_g17.t1